MKCWCCGVSIPKESKVELCIDCMNAATVQSMQMWCSLHKKKLKPPEFSQ